VNTPHIPVLIDEVKDIFCELESGYFVDCTLGYAGHSFEILKSHENIKLIACDRDIEAINFSKNRLLQFNDRVSFFHTTFSNVIDKCENLPIRSILADIGVSSLQLDKKERGFGFDSDKLDMRMDQNSSFSAYDVINRYQKNELERVLRDYGELREYKKIAKKICDEREKEPIDNAKRLADIVGRKSQFRGRTISPATLVFQAVRIEVNSELDELKLLLESIKNSKINNCILAIISFHSLEDRIVKQTFKTWAKSCICSPDVFRCDCGNNNAIGQIVTKKAIEPSLEEIKQNPRSRSSKLRAFYIERERIYEIR
jgi:16S rRNA (cytosine1402-N4)-methyltransferase